MLFSAKENERQIDKVSSELRMLKVKRHFSYNKIITYFLWLNSFCKSFLGSINSRKGRK